MLDRALIFQTLDENKVIEDSDIRKMLGLADKSKLINLIGSVFTGNEKEALEKLKDLSDNGLDARNFLNDFLELLYFLGRRINLGPIQKDMFLSEGEINLIEKVSNNLNMQDLSLFWQLTLKAIEDLKIISSEEIALEMFLMQLMHVKNLEDYSQENTIREEKNIEIQTSKKKINQNDEIKSVNFIKDQMKNTEQIKSLNTKEFETNKKLQITSFSDLIKFAEEKKEIQLKYDLERNVKLVSFKPGKIDITFNEKLNKNFIKILTEKLIKWTGERWIISLSKSVGNKTLFEKQNDEKKQEIEDARSNSKIKSLLNTFSDAKLINVEKKEE